ncbi:MAG: tRNA 2-thiouridine(34) synthase MnmA [Pseudomonadota bacterium]
MLFNESMKTRVLIAMSGGIDSSVAAYLLRKEGYDVTGITMEFPGAANKPSRSGLTPAGDAAGICGFLGMPHQIINLSREIEDLVIKKFATEYSIGRTPNPCVDCNRFLKFGVLLERALSLGFDFFATGHYAQTERTGSRYLLAKPRDRNKDQTYFLYRIPGDKLNSILFPLARLTKEEVREIARREKLPIAERPESQDLCFLQQDEFRAFILQRISGVKTGPIVDLDGNILGQHKGIIHYTVGQRGGLGVPHKHPLYVLSIDAFLNTIIVGEKKDLRAAGLMAGDLNNLAGTWPSTAHAKTRYRQSEFPCRVFPEGDKLRIVFDEDHEAVTPGQSVVLYDGDIVLGGGTIEKALNVHR